MTPRLPSWRRAATVLGTTVGAAASIAGVLVGQAYVMVVTATAFAVIAGVLLVLAVRAFNVLLPIYVDRARIENDRRRVEWPALPSAPERAHEDRRPAD